MTIGYKFAILNSTGTGSTTYVDMDDMFVPKYTFVETGLYTWGKNSNGQLGDGTTTDKSSPILVGSRDRWKAVNAGGNYFSAGIKLDGTFWIWGNNALGQLGLGDTTDRSRPTQLGTLTNWQQVSGGSSVFAVKTDGTLWSWGYNINGQLGLGDTTSRSSPVQVGALTNWSSVSSKSGYTVAAIKTDGTLWTWGHNGFGTLGQGDTVHRSSPVQVGALTNWTQVSCGDGGVNGIGASIAAIKDDGTLWTWGLNSSYTGTVRHGNLGLGDTVHRSSPVQVGALTNWKQVSMSAYHCAAIKTDGTLWSWGYNSIGQLGDGTTTHRSSPVQIGALTNWKEVNCFSDQQSGHSAATKTDGTLWMWGHNGAGQLGLVDTTNRSSPTQVGYLTTWRKVVPGGTSSLFAHTIGIIY